MSYIYKCCLEVPVWTAEPDPAKAARYRPRLVFSRAEYEPQLLVCVSAWVDDLPGRDRWMVEFYPPDQTDLQSQKDDGDYWKRERWPRRPDPQLSDGELRHPRDTAATAIKLTLELLADVIPKGELAAMEKVATILRPQLEVTARYFLTCFRPTKQAPTRSRRG
jgi:hypothetical protein